MFAGFTLLCLGMFAGGYFLTWLLFHTKNKQFSGSTIQTKIHFWIPIFIIVMLLALKVAPLSIIILFWVAVGIGRDYMSRQKTLTKSQLALAHAVLVLLGMTTLVHLSYADTVLFLGIWYVSVASDVAAYFFGNFAGKHHLPDRLNNRKSWEGVAGQVVGAFIGFVAFNLVAPLPFWLWITVGIGSAVGDLTNSYIKRLCGFKDWSNAIPGHGGYIDRLCSLGYGILLTIVVMMLS